MVSILKFKKGPPKDNKACVQNIHFKIYFNTLISLQIELFEIFTFEHIEYPIQFSVLK